MAGRLEGRMIAILATDGVEQVELVEPREALEQEGAVIRLVANRGGELGGMNHLDKADMIAAAAGLEDGGPAPSRGLMLPGGGVTPDSLGMDPRGVDFARHFYEQDKPIAAICHAPWLLVEAD